MSLYDPALRNHTVLIESDWNLKVVCQHIGLRSKPVLIESDWNLKVIKFLMPVKVVYVLIESDWNLQRVESIFEHSTINCINRIRLEFKVC